jgi:hypothetical protein
MNPGENANYSGRLTLRRTIAPDQLAALGVDPPMTARAERHEVRGGVYPALTPWIEVVRLQVGSRAPALDASAVPGDHLPG